MSRRRPPAPAGFAHSSFGTSGFGPSEYPGFAPQRISPGRARRRRSARAPWGWAIAGALLGLIFTLAWQAPARWLAAGLRQASGGAVQLAEPQGTLWRGSARLMLAGGQGSRGRVALPGRVHWHIRPAWAGLHIRALADCCTPQGALAARLHLAPGRLAVQVQDGQSSWPATVLTGLGTLWNTVQLQGEITLQTRALQAQWAQGRLQVQGQAQISAQQVASRLSPIRPLGAYRLTFEGGPAPTLHLSSQPGSALLLEGQGQWVGQRLRFSGQAQAAEGVQEALHNLLNILGRRQGDKALISFG